MPRKRNQASKPSKAHADKAQKPVDQKGKKAASDTPNTGPLAGTGHNSKAAQKLIVPYYERYASILEAKASTNAAAMADCRVLIEDAANDLGTKKRLVRQALADKWRYEQQKKKEEEMPKEDVGHLDTMRDLLGLYGTPLGDWGKEQVRAEKKAAPRGRKVPVGESARVVPLTPKGGNGAADNENEMPEAPQAA